MPALPQRCSSSFVNIFGTPLTNTPLQTPWTNSFKFVDAFTPVPKRRKLQQVPSGEIPNSGSGHDEEAVEKRKEEERKAAEDQEKKQLEGQEKKEED